jgi:predicted nuclease of predicted toxin-antitoxin system
MLKFLVDEQLPGALVRWLEVQGYIAYHVDDIGLVRSNDVDLVARAKAEDLVVVSKDKDFIWPQALEPHSFQLVVVALGNHSNSELLLAIAMAWPTVSAALRAGDRSIVIQP